MKLSEQILLRTTENGVKIHHKVMVYVEKLPKMNGLIGFSRTLILVGPKFDYGDGE